LELLQHDVHHLAMALLWRFHLDPQTHYPDLLVGLNLRTMAPLAAAYISVRLLEAYGLWKEKLWGEWLAALSGALYIPLEVAHLMHSTTLANAGVLLANLLMVGFLGFQLWRRLRPKPAADTESSSN
jgi:uncharacterized membrane protein (DUF2068 family)